LTSKRLTKYYKTCTVGYLLYLCFTKYVSARQYTTVATCIKAIESAAIQGRRQKNFQGVGGNEK